MRSIILGALCVGAIVVPDGAARRNAVTYVGTVGGVAATQPSPWDAAHRPSARLVVSGAAIDARFDGYTGATHDSGSARASCSSRYQLVKRDGAWSYYRQVGASLWPGRDYMANSPCIFRRGGALKTTMTGSRLRADFSLWNDVGHPTYWRGYLQRT